MSPANSGTGRGDAVETGQAYPQQLSERVTLAANEGGRVNQMARRFKSASPMSRKVLSRRTKTGKTVAGPQVNHVAAKLAAHAAALKTKLQVQPDLTLAELQAWLVKEHKLSVRVRVIWKILRRLGITRKKLQNAPEQDRPEVAEARAAWRIRQASLNPAKLIFIDETRSDHQAGPPLWPGAAGQRANVSTFIAALRSNGMVAPWAFNRAMDGELFLACVEQQLAPTSTGGHRDCRQSPLPETFSGRLPRSDKRLPLPEPPCAQPIATAAGPRAFACAVHTVPG